MTNDMPEFFEVQEEPKSDAFVIVSTKGSGEYATTQVVTYTVGDWEEGLDYRQVLVIEDGVAMLRLRYRDHYIPLTEIKTIEIRRPSAEFLARWEKWFKSTHGGMSHEEFHVMRRQGAVDNKVAAMVAAGLISEDIAGSIIGAVHEIIGDYLESTYSH